MNENLKIIYSLLPDNDRGAITEKNMRDCFKIVFDSKANSDSSELTSENITAWKNKLEKNLANEDLTNNATRTFTQNAPYNWNTMGNPYRISGLINAEHDQTFVNEVLLRADGTMGIIPKRNFLNLSMQNTNIIVNHIVPRDIKTTQFGEKVKEYLLNYGSQPFTPFRKADYEEIQTLGGLHKDKCSVSEDGLLHLVVNNDDFKTAPGYDTNTDLLTLQGKKILPHDKDWMVKIDVIDASASVLKNVVGIGNTDLNPVAGVEYNNFSQAGHFGYTPIAYMTWNTYTRQKSFSVFIIKTDAILNILIYAADILYYHIVSSEPSFGNYFPIIKLKKPVNIHNEKNSNIKLKISYKIIP